MALITPVLEKRFLEIGNQSNEKDPVVIAKFHDSFSETVWFIIEYDIETESGYGFKVGGDFEGDWESFSISELEAQNEEIELDVDFSECFFSEVAPEWWIIEYDISLPSDFVDPVDRPEHDEAVWRLVEIEEMRREWEADKLDGWER